MRRTYRLMVSDERRPWISASQEASQVRYRPLEDREDGYGGRDWAMGFWYSLTR